MAGTRRKGRVAALQALYESDCASHDAAASLTRLAEEYALVESSLSFACTLVDGVLENKNRIDSLIQTHAPSWPVEQLPVVDRNILRLAIFEISIDNKVPTKAAINEAVELAKTFGSYNSPRFVNGVLGSIARLQAKANS
jgi:N utilization substance protein B